MKAPKLQSACCPSSPPETLMNTSPASSVKCLQNPHKPENAVHKPFFEPAAQVQEHRRWNGQALLRAKDEELTSACQAANVRHENRHTHLDGTSDPHAFFNPIDPCLRSALSIQSGVTGVGRVKAGKRKSRVSSKVPIKVFSADAANFMAIVHKLTGFQSTMHLSPEIPRKPLPLRPLLPAMQGMCNPEISEFPSTLSHLDSCIDQRAQLGSFGNGSPSATIQGEQAFLPRLWQPTREYSKKDEPCNDVYSSENKLPIENVCGAGWGNQY